jgi:hypothetical protein
MAMTVLLLLLLLRTWYVEDKLFEDLEKRYTNAAL